MSARKSALRALLAALALVAALVFAACGETQDDESLVRLVVVGVRVERGGGSERRDPDRPEDRLDSQAARQPLRGVRALRHR